MRILARPRERPRVRAARERSEGERATGPKRPVSEAHMSGSDTTSTRRVRTNSRSLMAGGD